MYMHLANGNIDICIAGHTHRAAVHYVNKNGMMLHSVFNKNENNAIKLNDCGRSLISVDLQKTGLKDTAICLVNGASGLYSKQNIFHNDFYDFDSPMAMELKFNEAGKPSKVKFPKYNTYKPRLAVRLDYLWVIDNLKPFERQFQFTYNDGDVIGSHTRIDTKDAQYQADFALTSTGSKVIFNKKWLQFFNKDKINWLHNELPIEYMSLHAVHKSEGQYVKMHYNIGFKANVQTPNSYSLIKTNGDIFTSKCLQYFVKEDVWDSNDGLPKKDWLYFLSIKLNGIESMEKQYNFNSPWCYLVNINTSDNGFVSRNLSRIEIPHYDDYKRIEEYSDED